jgi:hypothetical protein
VTFAEVSSRTVWLAGYLTVQPQQGDFPTLAGASFRIGLTVEDDGAVSKAILCTRDGKERVLGVDNLRGMIGADMWAALMRAIGVGQ